MVQLYLYSPIRLHCVVPRDNFTFSSIIHYCLKVLKRVVKYSCFMTLTLSNCIKKYNPTFILMFTTFPKTSHKTSWVWYSYLLLLLLPWMFGSPPSWNWWGGNSVALRWLSRPLTGVFTNTGQNFRKSDMHNNKDMVKTYGAFACDRGWWP
jgi:hypothetical protein